MSNQCSLPEFKDEAVLQVVERSHSAAESFPSRLKIERSKERIGKTRELARTDIVDYIAVFYNRQRRHSHLGDVSPEAFEAASL